MHRGTFSPDQFAGKKAFEEARVVSGVLRQDLNSAIVHSRSRFFAGFSPRVEIN